MLSFKQALLEAQEACLKDPRCFLIGEGVPDPKACFGTTAGLDKKFPRQVFDMPVSENGITGVCIGAAINGMKPILVHQRIDFSLYSMDQIVNNAAKWFSMFGGQKSVPIVIRMIVGRGWGQGNQHSQNLTSMFAHVPGLKVFCPSSARDAKDLFIKAYNDPNPVIFIEHRWLYDTTSERGDLSSGIEEGSDITIVASGHAYREAYLARERLKSNGISAELIDLRIISPLDMTMIYDSVSKTKSLLVVDDCWQMCGVASEIIASVACHREGYKFSRLTYPNCPSASSPALTKNYYPECSDICAYAEDLLMRPMNYWPRREKHDVPNPEFRGPF